jgi:hypothetical protein
MSEFNTHAAYIQEIILDSSTAKISSFTNLTKTLSPTFLLKGQGVFFRSKRIKHAKQIPVYTEQSHVSH